MPFGQTVADASSTEAWIKGFKDGETRIRICQELPTWVKYLQHFSKVGYYFPCSKEPDCIGCQHPEELDDQGRPKMSAQYAFNALDDKGQLGIFRLGTKAFKILQSRHQRLGTLLDRDYVIVRTGKGFDTTYVPEPGDKYEVDIPTTLIDIMGALEAKYAEARTAILKDLEEQAAEAAEASAGAATRKGKGKANDEPIEAGPLHTPKADPTSPDAMRDDSQVDFEDLSTDEIKAWIAARPSLKAPERAARAALIKFAEANRDAPLF